MPIRATPLAVALVAALALGAGAGSRATAQRSATAANAAPPAEAWSLAPLVRDAGARPLFRSFERSGIGEPTALATSLEGDEAIRFFAQGLTLWHGLDAHGAERAFRQAAALHPNAAAPWVGAALAADADASRAGWFAEEAVLRRERANEVERALVDALATFHEVDAGEARARREAGANLHELPTRRYAEPEGVRAARLRDALLATCDAHSGDLELAAIHAGVVLRQAAIGLVRRAPDGSPNRHVLRARTALQRLAMSRPRHPARLYLAVHDVFGDVPAAKEAIASATRFAPQLVAPWLLAGRLTESLHRHADAADYYEAALRVANQRLADECEMPFERASHGLAALGLARSFARLGRLEDALTELDAQSRLPRRPEPGREDWSKPGPPPGPDPLRQAGADVALAHALDPRVGDRGTEDARLARALTRDDDAPALDPPAALAACDWLVANGAAARAVTRLAALDARFPDRMPVVARRLALALATGDEALATERFERLRHIAGQADLGHPLLAPAAAFAAARGLPTDWRLPRDPLVDWPRDLGPRPDFAALGPRHWSPPDARGFTVTTPEGRPATLAAHEGRPTVVILYLGFGCLHCIEALRAFHPLSESYRAAGIDLVAIGTDTQRSLRESLTSMSLAERLAIPMLSDRKLRVFHEWLAFDEFEHMPLHGTYLIDGDGRIRWRDIGDVPFERPRWLLDEAVRLIDAESR